MKKKMLLRAMLYEYHRQLSNALDDASIGLRHLQEPERIRKWNPQPFSIKLTAPPEDTPDDQWHWEEVYKLYPSLIKMQEALGRFDDFLSAVFDGK